MAVERRLIRSDPRATSPRPWFEYDIDPVALTATITRVTGPAASPECKNVTRTKERTIERSFVLMIDPLKPTEQHGLALTLEGNVIFRPASELPPVLYAHLGWIDPVTRDAVILEFVDDTI